MPSLMPKALQIRITAIVLATFTLAACVLAGVNFAHEGTFENATDRVPWSEVSGGLEAHNVPPDSPAERAGIRNGDLLIAVNDRATPKLAPFEKEIFRSGIWSHATYTILRHTAANQPPARIDIQVILEPEDHSINQGFRLIALAYLAIGIYVLFRRWTAPKSTHFYVFCLVSFVLYAFKYTGEFDAFDWTIFWGKVIAAALQPALFLHFAVTFGEAASSLRRRIISAMLYIPGAILVGIQLAAILLWSATERLQHRLDQISVGYLALYYVIAAMVFFVRNRGADSPLQRQQLKWLTRGTLMAVTPFTLLYVIPYLSDLPVSGTVTKLAGLSLVFLPLTFSYAIVRYRLMDVDLIFKRGVTYTLATAALVGMYFVVVAVSAEVVHTRLPHFGIYGLIAAIIVTALIFDPIKKSIQGRVDRIFDRKRFNYRETLIDFGRGLSSQTDLRALVNSIVERLPQTLLIERVAVFIAQDAPTPTFTLAAAHGVPAAGSPALHLGFLDFDKRSNNHLFLENPQHALRLSEPERQTAAFLDLNYYLPCRVANRQGTGTRTIAVIGLGRTSDGDFLSSEDMELLESLAGYIGIAIQNAQLYSRLELQIAEFERLKEFNENIVESINIGIFAVDLEDRIESWNAQMEVMSATPRADALNRSIAAVFPADFVTEFDRVKNLPGTHTLYKFRLTSPNGEVRTANIAIAPLVTRDFVAVGRIILVDDITDRVTLESQLTQAEKLSSIGLLAAGVAHEVNTPLAVISSYTQMLAKHMKDDERLAPVLEKITQQTFRASEIVNGLLNFSRTTGSEFTQVDLNHVLRDTLTLLDHQFKTAQITIDSALHDPLPTILGNQGKLQQVILNLMLNAKDAMSGQPGTLSVITRIAGNRVAVEISDSGSGIAPEHLHRIYDPFFTTKAAPLEGQRKGTGLGLAVSYGIIQEHSGKIHVESLPGRGTTFHLDFPIAAAAHSPQAANRRPTHV